MTQKPQKKGKKSQDLKENPDIKRWYDNLARGAESTADVYFRRLRAFCKQTKRGPSQLIEMDDNSLFDLLLDFVGAEEKRGVTGSYIETTLKSVRSWLAFKGIKVTRKIKVRGARQSPTLENERVPTQEELKKIFLNAITRDRVSCVLMAHAGVRPEVIGNYRGDDGLRLKDLPELSVEGNTVTFEKIPTMVNVRPVLSKSNHKYFTFLSSEGCEYLKEYLEGRLRAGEILEPDSDLVSPKFAKKKFIRSLNIGDGVRKALRSAGFSWRPYVLRAYCDTQLLLAESKGKMNHAYRQFFMGHKGDIEARYTVNKGRLTKEMIEDMRGAYRKSQQFLQTINTQKDEDEFNAIFVKRMFLLSGMSEDEFESLDLESKSDEEIMDDLKKRFKGIFTKNGNNQKVVPMREIEGYIEEGWEYVNTLPGDKGIIRIPH